MLKFGKTSINDGNHQKWWWATIAQWIRLRSPSCGPGSNPKHNIYASFGL